MAHDVFISYSSQDKPTADAVCAVLETNGIRCWIAPRDIVPGQDWGASLVGAIKGARVMVLVFSAHANYSPQIKREVERAVNHGIPIIPLRIEEVAPSPSLEYFISTPHWLDAFTPPLERHLQYLTQVIQKILGILPEDAETLAPAETSESPGQEQTSGKRGKFIYASLLLVIAIIGFTGWWLISQSRKAKEVPISLSSIAPSQAATNPAPAQIGETGGSTTPSTAGLNHNDLWTFTTIAGQAGSSGATDGIGIDARFDFGTRKSGIALDRLGNLYVVEFRNNDIRLINPSGVVSTLAGKAGTTGSSDGLRANARFASPRGIALDLSGNAYVADTGNHTIRKITPSGMVTTFAGKAGIKGSADGPAAIARFSYPSGVAVGPDGSIFVADMGNNMIRRITPDGVVSTMAGQAGTEGWTDGVGTSARFKGPNDIAVGTNGFIYVAEGGNNTIRVINPSGVVSTLAGQAGVAGSDDGVTTDARFDWPVGIAVDGEGNLYVADSGNEIIREITSAGVVTTIGGVAGKSGSKDGTGSDAWFNTPVGIAVDSHGNIYVSDDGNNTIRKGHRQSSPAPTATAQTTTMARQPNPPIVKPWENSLGMKFVPVPGTKVWFGIWDVRVRDYRAYAQANNGVHGSWQRPQWAGAVVTPREDCPVVAVSWNDAKAFCSWLTKKERDEKKISNSQSYRLPFEAEWSQAVGRSKYPWGDDWPPPLGAGNFADSTFKSNFPDQSAIDGYNDGYAMTSPVESFRPNQYGLYDMGGNVSQFCEDWYDSVQQTRVLRGSSWLDYKPANLLASNRGGFSTNRSHSVFGFRVVLADNSSR